MFLENMTSGILQFKQNVNIGQFCIHFMRIFAHWLNAKLGIRETPDGCRAIPSGHYNFDPALARAFGGRDGYTKAIIYQYIANWVIYNQEHGKNYVDGRFWSYNSGRAWADMIQLWDTGTVEKHIKFLRDEGVLDARAMKAHTGDQTLWFSMPLSPVGKESNGGTQIALPLDSNAPMVGAKAPNDSAIRESAIAKTAISNANSSSHAHLDAGGVAQFPKRDLDPKEGGEAKAVQPEARDLKESQDGGQHEPPPSSAPPSPNLTPGPSPQVERGEIPAWMAEFFSGCAESELLHLLHAFGEPVLLAAKKYAEDADHHVSNPPGFVRVQLARGWRPPAEAARPGWRARDGFDELADEPIEQLQWIISDDCQFTALYKAEARRLLAARLAVR